MAKEISLKVVALLVGGAVIQGLLLALAVAENDTVFKYALTICAGAFFGLALTVGVSVKRPATTKATLALFAFALTCEASIVAQNPIAKVLFMTASIAAITLYAARYGQSHE